MKYRFMYLIASVTACLSVGGCGIVVPDIKEVWESDYPPSDTNPNGVPGAAQMEFEIKKRIFCDLKEAVKAADQTPNEVGPPNKLTNRGHIIPDTWGAQVSLSLQIDEMTALNPGLSFNTTYPTVISYPARQTSSGTVPITSTPQSFGFGLGADLSSTATRIDKFDPYWNVKTLRKKDEPGMICYGGPPYTQNDPFYKVGFAPASSSPFILDSDLRIKEWLAGAIVVDQNIPSDVPPPTQSNSPSAHRTGGAIASSMQESSNIKNQTRANAVPSYKNDTISLEIKFVIVSSVNATPTWKLVRVSANTGSTPFFNTGRTRTHDLIITLGDPSVVANNTHLASQIGNAVSNGNRAQPPM
jgi:hypothetical protein